MSTESNYMKFPREFNVEPLKKLSPYAKLLYMILANRLEQSEKNKELQDDDGTPFVYFTVEELSDVLDCSKRTVNTTLKELENIGLIYRCRQYACKANKIYVKDIGKALLKAVNEKDGINEVQSLYNSNANSAPQSCKLCVDEVQNLHHNDAEFASRSCKICVQSIVKESNQKNKINERVIHIKRVPPKKNQEQENQEEQERKRQQAKEAITDVYKEAIDNIDNVKDKNLLIAILTDIYIANRERTYNISGKEVKHIDVYKKIMPLHPLTMIRAVEVLQEVRAKKYIKNEYMYLFTCLYNS